MTLSQIKNQVRSLQRQLAKELAVYRLRQLAEEIADDWAEALDQKKELPEPHQIIRRVANAGHTLWTYGNLHHYVRERRDQGEPLSPPRLVLALLPWAWNHRYDDLLYNDYPA